MEHSIRCTCSTKIKKKICKTQRDTTHTGTRETEARRQQVLDLAAGRRSAVGGTAEVAEAAQWKERKLKWREEIEVERGN